MRLIAIAAAMLLTGCQQQSHLINFAIATSMFTACHTIEDWAPDRVKEQVEAKKIKNQEDREYQLQLQAAKRDKMKQDHENRKQKRHAPTN